MGLKREVITLIIIILSLINLISSTNLRSDADNEDFSIPPLAWIAHRLAYRNYLKDDIKTLNFRTIESENNAFRCNIITLPTKYEDKIDIIVVFRGTKVEYLQNIFADINITPKKLKGICDGCFVHRGFSDAYETIKEEVMIQLKEEVLIQTNDGKKIENLYYAGHSLGGGMAAIGLYDFLNLKSTKEFHDKHFDYIKDVSFFSFGTPRVGNIKFAEFFNQKDLLKYNLRTIYGQDIVPHLLVGAPLSRYRHFGDFAHFRRWEFDIPICFLRHEIEEWKREGENFFDKLNIKDRIKDHSRYDLINPKGLELALKTIYKYFKE